MRNKIKCYPLSEQLLYFGLFWLMVQKDAKPGIKLWLHQHLNKPQRHSSDSYFHLRSSMDPANSLRWLIVSISRINSEYSSELISHWFRWLKIYHSEEVGYGDVNDLRYLPETQLWLVGGCETKLEFSERFKRVKSAVLMLLPWRMTSSETTHLACPRFKGIPRVEDESSLELANQ